MAQKSLRSQGGNWTAIWWCELEPIAGQSGPFQDCVGDIVRCRTWEFKSRLTLWYDSTDIRCSWSAPGIAALHAVEPQVTTRLLACKVTCILLRRVTPHIMHCSHNYKDYECFNRLEKIKDTPLCPHIQYCREDAQPVWRIWRIDLPPHVGGKIGRSHHSEKNWGQTWELHFGEISKEGWDGEVAANTLQFICFSVGPCETPLGLYKQSKKVVPLVFTNAEPYGQKWVWG
jgi:hypothetical protein